MHATNPCSRRRVPCSHVCVPTGDSATPTRCLCPAPLHLAGDNSTCSLLGNSSNSSSSKSAVVERQMKQLQLSQKKDDLMTVLLIGSIAGSLILLLLVRRPGRVLRHQILTSLVTDRGPGAEVQEEPQQGSQPGQSGQLREAAPAAQQGSLPTSAEINLLQVSSSRFRCKKR